MKSIIDKLRYTKLIFLPSIEYIFLYYLTRIPLRSIRQFILRRFFGMRIGDRTTIFMGTLVYSPKNITIGSATTIGHDCYLDGCVSLKIGNNVNISSEAMIWTMQHDAQSPTFGVKTGKVVIEDHAWVSTRAMVLAGVTIGKGAVVAAGAVVTKSVEPYTIVAGIPAKPIGKRNQELDYTLGETNWHLGFI
ncbi:acyltransferase [Limnofasciculus baicalensis]|uniref:acyltransferase n=1 Tax=Limnofasciculus baicalensis TaxID=3064906 RepID=UPI0035A0E14E